MAEATVAGTRPPLAARTGRRVRAGFASYARGLDRLGLTGAAAFLMLSLLPSLLPRTWPVQGVVSGISMAGGYALGAFAGWLYRLLRIPRPPEQVRRWSWRAIAGLAVIGIVATLWLGSVWQNQIRRVVHVHDESRYLYTGVLVVAVLVAALLLGLARLIRALWRRIARGLQRWLPPLAARSLAAVVVVVLVVGIATNVVGAGLRKLAEATFSPVDDTTPADVVRPTSADRSGAPGSLVPWDTLGREGRAFVARGPDPTDITALTKRPAVEPIRAYAGRKSADSLQGEADLVLAELKRTDAFTRAVLAVATTTGSGWVDPWAADTLEYMYGGDTAIAAIQYSYFPSWISFLVDKTLAREAGRTLFDTIYAYWASLPAAHRAKLVVFGTSLGAFGGAAAFKNLHQLEDETDAALFIGPPNSTREWRTLVARRDRGSSEVLPRIGDGRDVRFFSRPKDLLNRNGTLSHPRVAIAQHGSDPIVWWSPQLIWDEPDWLVERRARDVISAVHWYPFVTFWQLTCDLVGAASPPPGYGHTYGPELIAGWDALLHPAHWTAADTAALSAVEINTD